ncbi:arsenate-mycothiol transferase ArsC [Cognatishimia activa]|uniref:Arsenate reductase n=1 Tax=Cognatishimia activa TaxID=1715691 RepID=A0A0P1IYJ6_9RHOB|nr:low molecular weight phosphatase family protein [Cognatishimia activa]CUI99486.1 Arsenate reductase [Cognatishimia activa]CUK26233.1 Arsenate reductase [Cognatishimia activa]
MTAELPQSILFCCDHNAVRSPMAEGIMKELYGADAYVQSAGIKNDLEIDGFAISVCQEIGVELSRHQSRSFEEMEEQGEQLSSFDMVVALTPASHAKAGELSKWFHMDLQFWPIPDPTGKGETREAKLEAYRVSRDAIIARLKEAWGASG